MGKELNINLVERTDDGILVFRLSGVIGVEGGPGLEGLLRACLEENLYRVIFDIKNVDYVTSIGIIVILEYIDELKKYDGGLIIVNITEKVRGFFEYFNILGRVTIRGSIDTAKEVFRAEYSKPNDGIQEEILTGENNTEIYPRLLNEIDPEITERNRKIGKADGISTGKDAERDRGEVGVFREPVCFVLMPFTKELTNVYINVIKPLVRSEGIRCERADEIFEAGIVLEQIKDRIIKSDIIIADCTGKNANVYYEIGLAHAYEKPVILITQDDGDFPFDLQHFRHIIYSSNFADLDEFKYNLTKTISNIQVTNGE